MTRPGAYSRDIAAILDQVWCHVYILTQPLLTQNKAVFDIHTPPLPKCFRGDFTLKFKTSLKVMHHSLQNGARPG